jgi:hypothetical protein
MFHPPSFDFIFSFSKHRQAAIPPSKGKKKIAVRTTTPMFFLRSRLSGAAPISSPSLLSFDSIDTGSRRSGWSTLGRYFSLSCVDHVGFDAWDLARVFFSTPRAPIGVLRCEPRADEFLQQILSPFSLCVCYIGAESTRVFLTTNLEG